MEDQIFSDLPKTYLTIVEATNKLAFTMASERRTGALLKTLVASKGAGCFLELGTATGLATSWILEGMNENARLLSIDNNPALMEVARQHLPDKRVDFVLTDGYQWLKQYQGKRFDLVFADAIPGKYDLFEETIALVAVGGFYIVDDMFPQPNWPPGHAERVEGFIDMLEKRRDITLIKLNWSTGIIIVVKLAETSN
jgi:predicted O-methyltransferase YrrM